MQSFIHRKNLENYRKQLADTQDEATRAQLEVLLDRRRGERASGVPEARRRVTQTPSRDALT